MAASKKKATPPVDPDYIPFVPAFDLLAEAEKRLSPEEAAAIAFTLLTGLPEQPGPEGQWLSSARLEAIGQRDLGS